MSRLIFILLLVLLIGVHKAHRNERLTARNIVSVRPGMTMDQVKSIIGEPISMDSVENYTFSCPCNTERICYYSYSYTFNYTAPLNCTYPYPMLWVHFNSRKRVRTIYVKEYTIFDSKGIYWATEKPCDTLDMIVPITNGDSIRIDALRELFR